MSLPFDYDLDFSTTDFRAHPELYRIGKGEQGVLLVEPYKTELLPLWRFSTVEIAQKSSVDLWFKFEEYLKKGDFVGADMTKKFLQMGYTRARRYANHASGQKYIANPQDEPTLATQKIARKNINPQESDWQTNEKSQAAAVFFAVYTQAKEHPIYNKLRVEHIEKYEKKVTYNTTISESENYKILKKQKR